MRRLARTLFTLCSAVSLVLCAGVVGLWVSSARFIWIAGMNEARWTFDVVSDGGLVGSFGVNDDPDYPWNPKLDSIWFDRKQYSGPARDHRELTVLYRPKVYSDELYHGF